MTTGQDREPGDTAELEARLGHSFTDRAMLRAALTHSSLAPRGEREFERLEFLGDRVLGLVVAEMLMEAYPEEAEGVLTRRLVSLVRREALAHVAERLDLARLLHADEPWDGRARGRATMLADACEALIGALYLDAGLEAARRFIRAQWADLSTADDSAGRDDKTSLQEWLQGAGFPLPEYRVVERVGPDHRPAFIVEVEAKAPQTVTARGQGSSKRAAEQAAAGALREKLKAT